MSEYKTIFLIFNEELANNLAVLVFCIYFLEDLKTLQIIKSIILGI